MPAVRHIDAAIVFYHVRELGGYSYIMHKHILFIIRKFQGKSKNNNIKVTVDYQNKLDQTENLPIN